ncbi:hypothetical protein QFZ82_005937 [Streptomyces sp. V4I23]|nr:hypothetical protein [Streptomyces sp. V4I23]MDQ1011452.1 hypothetical protein [Streptomyces sp. V4I23]
MTHDSGRELMRDRRPPALGGVPVVAAELPAKRPELTRRKEGQGIQRYDT